MTSEVASTRARIHDYLALRGARSCSEIMSDLGLTKGRTYYALRDPRFSQLRDARWTLRNRPCTPT